MSLGILAAPTALASGVLFENTVNSTSPVAEQIGGFSKVPALVGTGSLGENLGTISNYALDGCGAGDYFRISATAPNGNVTTKTYIVQ